MSGDRDSEIAAVVFSEAKAKGLLTKLINEHTGNEQDLTNVCSFLRGIFLFSFFPLHHLSLLYLLLFEGPWHELARKNSKVYKRVYGLAVPDGEAATFDLYLFYYHPPPSTFHRIQFDPIRSDPIRFDSIRSDSIFVLFFE